MSRRWLLPASAIGALAVVGACLLGPRPEITPDTPPASAPPAPIQQPPEGLAGDFFGINEALSVPSALVQRGRLSGAQQRTELEEDARGVTALGATFVRANSHTYPFFNHFMFQNGPVRAQDRADRYFEVLGEAGLELLAVIGPWPGIQTANHTDTYLPPDMTAYTAFVESIVERYDGDGLDDAPGLLKPVRLWEIDNEPDLHNRVPPRGAKRPIDPATFQTPAEYGEVLIQTAAAIRRADPEATILSAGLYNVRAPAGTAYLKELMAIEGVAESFDVLALHCYSDDNSLDAIEQTIALGAELAPGRPIWITEIGVASQGKHRWQSEEWQAMMAVGLHAVGLIHGVEKMFWHTLSDPPQSDRKPLPFDHHSLMRTRYSTWEAPASGADEPRVSKPAGAAYARLIEHLAEVPRSAISEEETTGGRLMRAGDDLLAFWGTPTLPEGAWHIEDLITGQPLSEPAAPAWISPAGRE